MVKSRLDEMNAIFTGDLHELIPIRAAGPDKFSGGGRPPGQNED